VAGLPTLKKGSTGEAVKGLQNALNVRGGHHLTVDGMFGDLTDHAVRQFQHGSGLVTDGIVGPITWGALVVHEVQRGDSLSKIAKQHLGDAELWSAVFDLNRALIRDPDKIFPDQVLALPLGH
jgi:nucleoid-associated protein YgaU